MQPSNAPKTAILAELGSMALEFTRLAQITKNSKYYDAVARITNALEEFQMTTKLPGMWPGWIDASGCAPGTRGSTCSPQGLTSSPTSEEDTFSLGAYSGTVYENLIKAWLLLFLNLAHMTLILPRRNTYSSAASNPNTKPCTSAP